MIGVQDIVTMFQCRNINVDIDPLLLSDFDCEDKDTNPRNVSFSLFRLIYHIGVIQSRRFSPSKRFKFLDKTDLLEKIHSNTSDFKVHISKIRTLRGPEDLASISQDFGVGISAVITESFFKIKPSTITRILRSGKRPDWKCQTDDDRTLIVESKGSSSALTSRKQEINGAVQKIQESGDVHIASYTIINEDSISINRFLDPPIESNNNSRNKENNIMRAGHYASTFSFLGSSRLSIYYSQMRKRLEGTISVAEQELKNDTFHDLSVKGPVVEFHDQRYTGVFYHVDKERYFFAGVNVSLLSYSGFLNFQEYENEINEETERNNFMLLKDGILLIDIDNINYFESVIRKEDILNYQERITISDIDEMTELSFSKYFMYVLNQNGFSKIQQEFKERGFVFDLKGTFGDKDYFFEFKLFKGKINIKDLLHQLHFYSEKNKGSKMVLVTNANLDEVKANDENLIIFGRRELELLAKNSKSLNKILGN